MNESQCMKRLFCIEHSIVRDWMKRLLEAQPSKHFKRYNKDGLLMSQLTFMKWYSGTVGVFAEPGIEILRRSESGHDLDKSYSNNIKSNSF